MNVCTFLNCAEPGIWRDEDDGRLYCGAHVVYVAPDAEHDAFEQRLCDREKRREIREEIGDELRGERFDEIARRSW